MAVNPDPCSWCLQGPNCDSHQAHTDSMEALLEEHMSGDHCSCNCGLRYNIVILGVSWD